VIAATQWPSDQGRDLVGGNPHGEVGDREDRLIEHQDNDDRTGRQADRGGKLRQVDGIDGPAQCEHELEHGEIKTGGVRDLAHMTILPRHPPYRPGAL
jgi:hypothetical protein